MRSLGSIPEPVSSCLALNLMIVDENETETDTEKIDYERDLDRPDVLREST